MALVQSRPSPCRTLAITVVAIVLQVGCASPRSPQAYAGSIDLAPEPGVAKVLFVRDSEFGDSTLARIVDERGRLLVISAPGTSFTATLAPGEHTFVSCAGDDTTEALKASLRGGAVYAVIVDRDFGNVSRNYLFPVRTTLPGWVRETRPLGPVTPNLLDNVTDAACVEKGTRMMKGYGGEELMKRVLKEVDLVAPSQVGGVGGAVVAATPGSPPQRATAHRVSQDPRDAACRGGDSKACNGIGDSLNTWDEHGHPVNARNVAAARGYYLIACNRIIDSVPAGAARMVQICADLDSAFQKNSTGAPDAADFRRAVEKERPELRELFERVQACVNINDTYSADDRSNSERYDREMCRLEAVSADVGRHGDAVGLDSIVGTACDNVQFSREQAARDEQFRGQMAGILSSGVHSIGGAVVHGTAQLEAARHGIVLPDAQAATGMSTTGSSAACLDGGKSCESDKSLVSWKGKCAGNPPSQAPCYCAAVALYSCLIAHGCYAEAGAKQSNGQPSSTTLASLQQGAASNAGSAHALGTTCDAPPPACIPTGQPCDITPGYAHTCCSGACSQQSGGGF
ncbi:MAG TPA: hypothetical protein VK745_30775, partial [Polyangiaceae bacterium]|nr:hypothetical protein [Polyangiaceae bacterium]